VGKSSGFRRKTMGVEGNLFSVKDFNGVTPPTQMDFDKTKFWVRMFNLPQACMGEEVEFDWIPW